MVGVRERILREIDYRLRWYDAKVRMIEMRYERVERFWGIKGRLGSDA